MKVKLHIKLDGEDKIDMNVFGIKLKNTYKYKENNIMVTLRIKDNIVYLNRKCNDYNVALVFDKNNETESSYFLFGNSKCFKLKTKTRLLNIESNRIEINYDLEGNKFKYLLEVVDEKYIKRSN